MSSSRTTSILTLVVVVLFAGLAMSQPASAEEARATYTVSGKVVSDEGVPLQGVEVSAYTYPAESERYGYYGETGARGLTDETGAYSLELPAGRGYVNIYYGKWRAHDSRELVLEANATLDFTLKTPPPKTAIVTGRVVDLDGNPIAGAQVQLSRSCCYRTYEATAAEGGTTEPAVTSADDGASGSGVSSEQSKMIAPDAYPYWGGDEEPVKTDEEGRYTFTTYGGPQQLTASASGYAQTGVQVEAVDGETVQQDITLEKVPARDAVLRGRVLDAQTGLPIAGAQVSLNNLEWSRYLWNETGADGSFELLSLPGWSSLSVSVYGRGYGEPEPALLDSGADIASPAQSARTYYAYTVNLDLQSGTNRYTVELEPRPEPSVVLIGYVVDPDAGKGVPGATLNVWNQDTGDWGSATTDKTGSYKILVRPGHYTMNAWAEGHLGGNVVFTIGQGEATKRVDIETPKGTTKYAPCDEDCGYPAVSYDKATADGEAGATTTIATRETSEDAMSPPPGLGADERGTTATAYQGSGGGLPEYGSETATEPGTGAAIDRQVPGAGVVAAIGALGAAVLVLRRRI